MKFIIKIIAITFVLLQTANADTKVKHGFKFNAHWDSPDIRILNYRYGSSDFINVQPPEERLRIGNVKQQEGKYILQPLGDELYVKWKIKSTGAIHEDTVDLKSLLPLNMEENDIQFIMNGSQLHVYVVTQNKWRKKSMLTKR